MSEVTVVYECSISETVVSGVVDPDKLGDLINQFNLVEGIDSIEIDGDTLKIHGVSLDPANEPSLEAVIANHNTSISGISSVYECSISSKIPSGSVNAMKLQDEIDQSGLVDGFKSVEVLADLLQVWGDSFNQANESALEAIIAAHEPLSVEERKVEMIESVDAKTGDLICCADISFAGKIFSCSENAQINATNIFFGKEAYDANGMFPLRISAKDGSSYDLPKAEVDSYYFALVGAKQGFLDSGAVIRDSILAATTHAELDAITDNR